MAKKVSEITTSDLAEYLRLTDAQSANAQLETLLDVAKSYIRGYTGLDDEAMDNYTDLVIVVYVLVADMYDRRSLIIEKGSVSPTVETILGMHSMNLL